MSIFTVAVLQGLNSIDIVRHSEVPIRVVDIVGRIGSTKAYFEHTCRKLRVAGIITVIRGPGGGFGITEKQLRTKTVLDVLSALGQPVFTPEGSRASDRLQQRFYDACNVTLEEFFE